MPGEELSSRSDAAGCCASGLPCAGCPEAVASVSRASLGNGLSRSDQDGCWVVRIGHSEKLRSDDACLACSFFRNRAQLLAG
ncbi:hypothetical protein amb0736 [Paramagnetospirillum magneticum AMB-1]|uniref:Uncharacterized protein n=1 Tax=Paramagnetospirillum magneticum (strain ATCC 700264 / AMB-1) TaxID=342108 RepID=Q2W9D5_PARM1|nr:hypothetical protein amb0736 [Paramagnetospirillum magneticum AMB-1]